MNKSKSIFLAVGVLGFGLVSAVQVPALIPQVVAGEGNMVQVQLILKKLRSSMVNMKDFDDLEEAGMDKADVDRLRNAMKGKIKQMTSEAVNLIRVL